MIAVVFKIVTWDVNEIWNDDHALTKLFSIGSWLIERSLAPAEE